VNWPVENGEGIQVLHYRPGAEYKPHYDYFDPTSPARPPSSSAAASASAHW
jgi:prolyl 4-hydroxylase